MRRLFLCSCCLILFLGLATSTAAQTIVPAGTLLQCSLDEPNFSSATVSVEDPVVCYLKSVQQFGHIVLPRGSYLQGHLEAAKNPGHFWGKGYLRLEFDRIGLPSTDIPVPSKVVAASGGYKTDRQGDVKGKGHAKRDVAEWLFPPLWPWKFVTLPARGPRPTFKGEEILTLRLMDDIVVPNAMNARPASAPGWSNFGPPPANLQNGSQPRYSQPVAFTNSSGNVVPDPRIVPQMKRNTLIALTSEQVLSVTSYRMENGRLSYVLASGEAGSVDRNNVDWTMTSTLNSARATTAASATRAY